MRKNIIFFHFFFHTSCEKKHDIDESKIIDFIIYKADTLKAGNRNQINYTYKNTEFDNYKKRYLDIYYIMDDSVFNGEFRDLENFDFGVIEDVDLEGKLNISTPNEKKNMYITFFVYDEVQVPTSKDSINVKYIITKFVSKTYLN